MLDIIATAKSRRPNYQHPKRAKKSQSTQLRVLTDLAETRAIKDTINIYVDAVKDLYARNSNVIEFARQSSDINIIDPLKTAQDRFRNAKQDFLRNKDLDQLDYQLYELERVIDTISKIHAQHQQLDSGGSVSL